MEEVKVIEVTVEEEVEDVCANDFETLGRFLIIYGVGSQLAINMDHVDSINVFDDSLDYVTINFLMYSGVTRDIRTGRVHVKEILNILNKSA